MGQAKQRREEIALLKQTPREERKKTVTRLGKAKTETVFHFRNAAARASIDPTKVDVAKLTSVHAVTEAVKAAQIPQSAVSAVSLPIMTTVTIEPTQRPPRQSQKIRLVFPEKLTPEQFAAHVIALAQMNPKGFRQPSDKPKRWQSTSLVEKVSIAAAMIEPNAFAYSKRGLARCEAREDMKAAILVEREKPAPLKYQHSAARERAKAQAADFFKDAA